MAQKKESKLQRKIKKALINEFGGFWIKLHGGMFQKKGMPDLLGCVWGLYITVEVKTDDKASKLMPHQIRVLKTIRGNGGCGVSARSEEEAILKVKKHLVKYYGFAITKKIISSAKKSSNVCFQDKESRIIHGGPNWEDVYRSIRNGQSTQKTFNKRIYNRLS
jgi:Holliday junction resolvase